MRHLLLLVLLFSLFACGSEDDVTNSAPDTGPVSDWRLIIQLPEVDLPVQLHLAADGSEAWISNGAEKAMVSEVSKNGDSYKLHFPAFNSSLLLYKDGSKLKGSLTLVKRGYEQVMQVTGEPDPGYRFRQNPQSSAEFTGRWEVTFVDGNGKESSAIGEFDQKGSTVSGTFLTPVGDYRYLAGDVDGNMLHLSTFDGAHAFVFHAEMQADGSLEGDFWSGTRWHESWTARRNFEANLPDAYAMTYLKDGYDRLEFSFPDLDGNPVALSDQQYKDKVVLVTLSGTWCPNCADEIEFLSGYYRDNQERGLEVITLLYEHFEAFEETISALHQAGAVSQWRCLNCEHVHPGASAPQACPVCASPADRFEPFSPSTAKATVGSQEGLRIIIVGAGIAGVSAAEAARRASSEADIILLSRENYLPYYRLNLTRYLAGEIVSVQAAESSRARNHDVEDTAAIIVKFASGAIGTITVSDSIVAPWSWELTAGENPAYPVTDETCYFLGGTRGSLEIPKGKIWSQNMERASGTTLTVCLRSCGAGDMCTVLSMRRPSQ